MKTLGKILMVSPEYFDVIYQINPHMDLSNKVDKDFAAKQWDEIKATYEKIGFKVEVIPGHKDYPDMVFCANPLFSTPKNTILSNMAHDQRKGEVEIYADYFKDVLKLESSLDFEGNGDLLWNYQTQELYGGYGFRTSEEIYIELERILNKKILRLKLINESFYHLDTCLCIIDDSTACYVQSAFDLESIEVLKGKFKNLVQVDELEAMNYLACNAFSPDGKNILIEKNAKSLEKALKGLGYITHSLDTSEFIKSGGSIFCMKHYLWC